jgi:hypothetical protein
MPLGKLKDRLKKLCDLHGIRFQETKEAYTSKASVRFVLKQPRSGLNEVCIGQLMVHINSGYTPYDIDDTAVPCPYARLIVGTRHCRVLYIIPADHLTTNH